MANLVEIKNLKVEATTDFSIHGRRVITCVLDQAIECDVLARVRGFLPNEGVDLFL